MTAMKVEADLRFRMQVRACSEHQVVEWHEVWGMSTMLMGKILMRINYNITSDLKKLGVGSGLHGNYGP